MSDTVQDVLAVGTATPHDYAVTRCRRADLPALMDYRLRAYGPANRISDLRRSSWLNDANPFHDDAEPAVWLAHHDGDIVGTNAAIRFVLRVDDELVPAQWGVDLHVDPQHRGVGLAGRMNQELRTEGHLSCALGMSEQGLQHSLRNGYQIVATVPTYVLVLNHRPLSPGSTLRWTSRFLGTSRAAVATARGGLDRGAGTGPVLRAVPEFDDRGDAIWNASAPSARVLALRNADYLRWRFDAAPDAPTYDRYYLERGGDTVGFVVTQVQPWQGAPALCVIDYLAPPDELAALFRRVKTLARRQGVPSVVCRTLSTAAHGPLLHAGFVAGPRGSGPQLTVRVAPEDPRFASLTDPGNWFLTLADSDLS